MGVSKDFEELFECLTARNVEYVVVGGHAVAHHAKPRYTKDIDIFIDPADDNVVRLLEALRDFGFGTVGLTAADFAPGRIVQLGVAPNRVDFLTTIAGVSFAEAKAGRVPGRYGSKAVWFIGKEELKRNKREAGRPQDMIDVSWLEKA